MCKTKEPVKTLVKNDEIKTVKKPQNGTKTITKAMAKADKPTVKRSRAKKKIVFQDIVNKAGKLITPSAAKKLTTDVAVEININGVGEGIFYIAIMGGVLKVEPYDYVDNDIEVHISSSDFLELVGKKTTLFQLIEKEKIAAYGDLVKGAKLAQLFKK